MTEQLKRLKFHLHATKSEIGNIMAEENMPAEVVTRILNHLEIRNDHTIEDFVSYEKEII